MMTVWKTVLKAEQEQTIFIPRGSTMLRAAEQGGNVCVWYQCKPGEVLEPRLIIIAGTDHQVIEGNDKYLGTATVAYGRLQMHVFERPTT